MKTKVIVTEQQFTKVLKHKLQENHVDEMFGMSSTMNSNQPTGAIEISKQDANNTNNVTKYTSKGIDVKVMSEDETALDETLGEPHEVTMRHKYNEEGCLNLYSTKESVSLREVLKYVNGLKDQPMVEDSFNNEKVNLYVKVPASGRYKHLGGFSKDALSRFRAIADKEAVTGVQSEALNEALSEPVK